MVFVHVILIHLERVKNIVINVMMLIREILNVMKHWAVIFLLYLLIQIKNAKNVEMDFMKIGMEIVLYVYRRFQIVVNAITIMRLKV